MNSDAKKLVLVYVKLPVLANDVHYLREDPAIGAKLADVNSIVSGAVDLIFKPCKDQCVKLGEGVYLADENACYPAIFRLMLHCEQSGYSFVVSPVAESALTFSPHRQELKAFLDSRNQDFRLTQFPPPTQPNKP